MDADDLRRELLGDAELGDLTDREWRLYQVARDSTLRVAHLEEMARVDSTIHIASEDGLRQELALWQALVKEATSKLNQVATAVAQGQPLPQLQLVGGSDPKEMVRSLGFGT